jgi:hypothetical protein
VFPRRRQRRQLEGRAWAANDVAGRPPHPKRRNVVRRRQDGESRSEPETHETSERSNDASTTVAFPPVCDMRRFPRPTSCEPAQPIPAKTDRPNGPTHRRSNRRNKRVHVAETSEQLILTTTSPRPPTPYASSGRVRKRRSACISVSSSRRVALRLAGDDRPWSAA